MNDILNQLKVMNRELVLDDDLLGFTIAPALDENEKLLHLITLNSDRILELLVDSNRLITAIEDWAKDNPKKWMQAWTVFRKDYKATPYTWDAHDYLISWLNANERMTSARKKFKQLQKRKNKSVSEIATMDARFTDIRVYKEIAILQRQNLVTALLYHSDLYGQINKYMERHHGKKEEANASK